MRSVRSFKCAFGVIYQANFIFSALPVRQTPTNTNSFPYVRCSDLLIQVLRFPLQNRLHGERRSKWLANTAQINELPLERKMTNEQMQAEIREANMTYLMLAQNLIRQDKAEALFRLGMSEDAAEMISALSPAQIMRIAASNMLLCRFRVDDDMVWNLLTNHTASKVDNDATTKLHASILMAGRFAEAV